MNSKFKIQKSKLPFILVNMAMTADGKIATANRAVTSFGSRRDHEHLLELRATADAVMCGARTADFNKINLGPGPEKFRRARLKRGLDEFNLRILVSGSGTIDPDAEVFRQRFSPIILLTTTHAAQRIKSPLLYLADEVIGCGSRAIDFENFFRWLGAERGVKRLLCEGGGELNDALFRTGLVDELHLTVCPKIFAGRNAPTIAEGMGLGKIPLAAQFELKSSRRVGDEMFLTFAKIH